MESLFVYVTGFPGELLLVFGAVFISAYLLYERNYFSCSGQKLPPALPSLPMVGSLPFMPTKLADLAEFCISPKNKLGKIFSLRLGSKYIVVISGRKAIYEALVVKWLDFSDRPEMYTEKLTSNNNKGIVFANYDSVFRRHHQLCLSILKRFGFGHRVMETRILVEVQEMIRKLREKQGCAFNMKHLTASCIANVMINMIFGRRFDHSDPSFQQMITDVEFTTSGFSMALEIFPLLRFLPYFKQNHAKVLRAAGNFSRFVNQNIAACVEAKTESFVNYFIEAQGADYDAEQLLITSRQLIGTGSETTSTFILWAVVLLANHISVQERLHAEIDSVIGRQRLPTLDDRSKLPYVEATILEVLRYKTIGPMAMPHFTSKDTEVSGCFIPRGTTVLVNLWSAHMDPDDWHLPQQFRPERFLDESGNVINRDRVIAFSLGKRSCLGEQLARQEMFLFLVSLLQNFSFIPPEGQDRIDVHEVWGATNAPSGYEVRLVERDD